MPIRPPRRSPLPPPSRTHRVPRRALALLGPAIAALVAPGPRAQCVVLPAGMTHWWRAENNANASLGAAHGTLNGSATYTAGRVGQAFSFGGAPDGVTVPHAASLDATATGFTVEFWFRINAVPSNFHALADKGHATGGSPGWVCQVDNSLRARFAWGNGVGFPEPVTSPNSVVVGTWHHFAGTWNGTSATIYLDGVSHASVAVSTFVNNTQPLTIGFATVLGRHTVGQVDEVSLYSRALAPAEVFAVYNAGTHGKCFGAPGLWNSVAVAAGDTPRAITTLRRQIGFNERVDLAVANAGNDTVTLLANDGLGSFSVAANIALTAPAPIAIASGNLNGGLGRDDLAVACEGLVAGTYRIAKIVDAGEPTQAVSYLTGTGLRPAHVAVADLNGDAFDDIAVAYTGELLGGGGIEVIPTFGTASMISTLPTTHVAAGDLDGDGDRDLVSLAQAPDVIRFYANNGAGTFTAASGMALGTSGSARSFCVGDIDSDGDLDVVVLIPELLGANRFAVYRNNGAMALTVANVEGGKFTAIGPISTPGTFALDVACGDFEDDTIDAAGIAFTGKSRKDVCLVSAIGGAKVHDAWNGTSFATTLTPTSGTDPVACVVADFDRDGCDDIAIANAGSDDVTINITQPPAISEGYGLGCAGSAGVPAIGLTGTPTPGAQIAVTLTGARANALALLALSGNAASAPGAACSVFLSAPLVTLYTFASGTGAAAFPFTLQSTASIKGLDVYLQWAVFDPAGQFLSTLALSNALRLQFGD